MTVEHGRRAWRSVALVEFEVIGVPAPAGSKTRMPNGAMLEGRSKGQRDKVASWRDSVAAAARDVAADVGCLDGPLGLSVEFRFTMPKARPKAMRAAGRVYKVSAPDLDKLLRLLGDALKDGGLIADDARICAVEACKVEVASSWSGAIVRITQEVDP